MDIPTECVSGVRHEGEPRGNFEDINGANTYVALGGNFAKEKAILFITDIFGAQLNNNKVDDFAANGFQVYMPDIFEGEPIPADALSNPNTQFDRAKWSARHTMGATRLILDKAVAGLRERGITIIGAVGYCFGARHVIDLAKENTIASAVVAHPSRLVPAEDFPELLAKSKAPLLINSCEVDNAFPAEACEAADSILGGGKYQPGYAREHWLGCSHGFAVRGDMTNPKVKAGKEGAFKKTVEWFLKL
ncbi:alpha/beta-hydrolase [Hysterangium stoloniferum]|nr:alpha/beta-hydrolase [Hysterangium stoloniferum]